MTSRRGSGRDVAPPASTGGSAPASAPSGSAGGARIIGRSAPLAKLLRQIELVAPTEATVLIRGERGTGKELVADAIQDGSRRRRRSYVKVNCGALLSDLLASELFGHARGAFTGALERKVGLLAEAAGGTLFLDEVGDLSREAQAMLLRFLDHGEVRPLGSTETFRVDVRLIVATNKDLELAIQQKEFRADLYDRLSEVVLEVQPLSERREDIPLLVEHFLALYPPRHGTGVPTISHRALRILWAHSWPGNVRELQKVLRQAVIFARGGRIRAADLRLPALAEVPAPASLADAPLSAAFFDRADALLASPEVDQRGDGMGKAPGSFTERQREALRTVALYGAVRPRDLVRRFGVSREWARQDLLRLVRAGLLRLSGSGRGACYAPGVRLREDAWEFAPRDNAPSRRWYATPTKDEGSRTSSPEARTLSRT